jgi:dienelactone hydrolase
MAISLLAATIGAVTPDGYQPVRLTTAQGIVEGRWTGTQNPSRAVLWLGSGEAGPDPAAEGDADGFDCPAHQLYPRMTAEFRQDGIASLRIRFRHPGQLRESVHDSLAGIAFLKRQRVAACGIVGHSFGGAVAAQTAALSPSARALVLLATQTYGAAAVAHLGPRCPVLIIHGAEDEVLAPTCSEEVYAQARHPKRLELIPAAGHGLDAAADMVTRMTRTWLREHLG